MCIININLGSLNCKGFNNNEIYIKKLLTNMDLIFLTETWIGKWDPKLICEMKILNTHIVTTSNSKFKHNSKGRIGCQKAWLVKNTLYKLVKFEHINDRISVAKIEIPNNMCRGYAVIGCYLSSNNNKNQEYENDLAQIHNTFMRLSNLDYKTIILGDFNGDSDRLTYVQDKILKNWLNSHNLTELTRLFTQPIPYTFLSSIGSFSCIDHIVISNSNCWPEIRDVNILHSSEEYKQLKSSQNWKEAMKGIWDWQNNLGDHRAINIKLNIMAIKQVLSEKFLLPKKINWSVPKNQSKYAEIVFELIEKSNIKSKTKSHLNELECEKDLDMLNEILKKAEKIFLETCNFFKAKSKFSKSKKWWCTLLTILVFWRNNAHKSWLNSGLTFFKKLHGTLNKRIKKVSSKRKKYLAWLERQELMKKYIKNPNSFWKDIKSKRGARVEIDIDPDFLRSKYKENFNTLTQSTISINLEKEMSKVNEDYVKLVKSIDSQYHVDSGVIEDILKKLSNNKKSGKNGLSNEVYKYSRCTGVSNIIANIIESMINGGFCTNNINIGIIITIIKDVNGCQKNFDNTRPITVSETISMVLEELVMRDIARKCNLNRHQFGFTVRSSCAHAVYSIKEIAHHARANKMNAIALFLDFSKAFDKVNRTKLWYRLIKVTSPKYWLLLKNYYEKMSLFVVSENGEFTLPFGTSVGVKQGGKLSPFLYNLLVDTLLNNIEASGLTYKVNGKSKGILVYADDTNVICDSFLKMRLVIQIIENFCSDFDITINVRKTKWMRLTPNYSLYNECLQIGGVIVEEVKVFKFLGVILTANGDFHEHYNNRRKLFFGGISEINNFGFNSRDMSTKVKALLYTSLARSKLVYGLETILLKKDESHKLLSTLESNQIKKACNLSSRSKSKILLYALGISPIEMALIKRKIGFLIQLCNNTATADLIIAGSHHTLIDIYKILDIDYERDIVKGGEHYLQLIRRKCIYMIKKIVFMEKKIMNTDLVRCVKYLLNNSNPQNDDTVQYLLDPRRFKPG
jgi:hypothetical protein